MRPDRERARPDEKGAGSESSDESRDTDIVHPAPHEATEAALLGTMMLASEARAGAPQIVCADDFDREAHRVLYETIVTMLEAGQDVDPVTVNMRLVDTGQLEVVGGALAVHDLTSFEGCPTPAYWRAYARFVAREGRRRRGIRRLQRAIDRLEAGEDPDIVSRDLGTAA